MPAVASQSLTVATGQAIEPRQTEARSQNTARLIRDNLKP
jgi:hypothetical protein